MAQGGDFQYANGTGGESIYGLKFKDENFARRHTARGLLSMANSGPNSNGSQFFITFKQTPHLNGKHVVFGKVVEGMKVLDLVENIPTNPNDKPYKEIKIMDCGVVKQEEPKKVEPKAEVKAVEAKAEVKAVEAKAETKATTTTTPAAKKRSAEETTTTDSKVEATKAVTKEESTGEKKVVKKVKKDLRKLIKKD